MSQLELRSHLGAILHEMFAPRTERPTVHHCSPQQKTRRARAQLYVDDPVIFVSGIATKPLLLRSWSGSGDYSDSSWPTTKQHGTELIWIGSRLLIPVDRVVVGMWSRSILSAHSQAMRPTSHPSSTSGASHQARRRDHLRSVSGCSK